LLGSNVDTGRASTNTAAAASSTGRPRSHRPVGGRLSLGHVLPLALAVLAGLLVLAGLKDRSATGTVAVTTHSISAGQTLTGSDFRWVSVHRSDASVVTGLLNPADAAGPWVAAVDIPGGAPVALSELTRSSPALGLGSMSIQVPPSHADGGALQPGDRVDVISSASGRAVYLATDLDVLAVDQTQGGVLGSVQDSSYYVTVAVDRTTALRLAAALGASSSGGASTLQLVRSTGEAADPGAVYQPASGAGGRG